MIDFTQCEVNKFRAYGGANGNKINIRYQGEGYMLKFPLFPPEARPSATPTAVSASTWPATFLNCLGSRPRKPFWEPIRISGAAKSWWWPVKISPRAGNG